MDGHPRQNPAYRPATEKPASAGLSTIPQSGHVTGRARSRVRPPRPRATSASGSSEAHEPLALRLELALGRRREPRERLEDSVAFFPLRSTLHLPATAPSTRNVGVECGVFVSKTSGRKSLRQDLRPACVDEQRRVPGREEARRRLRRGAWERRARQVDELAALLVAEAAQAKALRGLLDGGRGEARPVGGVGEARRPEAGEVAAQEDLDALLGRHCRRLEPLVGQGVEVGPAPLPRPGRWRAHQLEPGGEAVPEMGGPLGVTLAGEIEELVAVQHVARQPLADVLGC